MTASSLFENIISREGNQPEGHSGVHSPASKCESQLGKLVPSRAAGRLEFAGGPEEDFYPSADQVGRRTVFNISGNQFRLVARINYRIKAVFVLHILTHEAYDKGEWKQ